MNSTLTGLLHLRRGCALHALGKVEDAFNDFSIALDRLSDEDCGASAAETVIRHRIRVGETKAAEQLVSRLKSPEASIYRGVVHAIEGKPVDAGALDDARKAFSGYHYFTAGLLENALGFSDAAQSSFEEFLKWGGLDPLGMSWEKEKAESLLLSAPECGRSRKAKADRRQLVDEGLRVPVRVGEFPEEIQAVIEQARNEAGPEVTTADILLEILKTPLLADASLELLELRLEESKNEELEQQGPYSQPCQRSLQLCHWFLQQRPFDSPQLPPIYCLLEALALEEGVASGLISEHLPGLVSRAWSALYLAARRLGERALSSLQREQKRFPSDPILRTLLAFKDRNRFRSHVLWLIENRPGKAPCGHPGVEFYQSDGWPYHSASLLWTGHVFARPLSVDVLRNAASFFLLSDRHLSEHLLLWCRELEPQSQEWPGELAHLYSLEAKHGNSRLENYQKAYQQIQDSIALTDTEDARYAVSKAANMAFEAGDYQLAREYANQLVASEPSEDEPSPLIAAYLHSGHTVLGRLALREGETEEAVRQLLLAGNVTTSPTLASFGPNMRLADELLEKGQKEPVLAYLLLCTKFWRMGKTRLERWMQKILNDERPDFGGNLDYGLG